MTLVIGAYGPDMGGAAQGVSLARERGDALDLTGDVLKAASPSWVSVRGDRMAATLEGTGELAWFRRSGEGWGADGIVELGGANPCHLAFLDDDTVAVACYGDGAVVVVRVGEESPRQRLAGSGSGPLPAQEGPHAHHVLVLADGRILTLDLGADRLHVHTRDESGLLERVSSIALPAGTGPRDLHMLPSGAIALLGEWSCELLLLDAETLEVREAHPLPGATRGDDQASALAVSQDGRFLYAGIRGANRIAVFALDGADVRPLDSVPSGGDWPRHLIVDGEFLRVANQRSDEVVTFRIPASGIPKEVSRLATPAPTCVVMTTPESLLS
ncbi:beta-propeller fold lactonase family protein [Salinibacterium sp. ZJ77]|uniref:lactonase family protein n=1 Tax=Salinibacterium sp. ZJ77 TaxID=2708337 RepID=UPI0014209F11|nr:beta-propeller fold lactonase family protein [Salinibacterium sp. ZJ77]